MSNGVMLLSARLIIEITTDADEAPAILRSPRNPVKWLWYKNYQLGGNMSEAASETDEDDDLTEAEAWEFATARSHEASKASYDLCKSIAQACLLINGGAATAVVALLAKDRVDVALLTYIPWGLVAYAFGVGVSAFMLYSVMMTADNWNFFWYHSSYAFDAEQAEASEKLARSWQKWMNNTFGFAIGCFFIGSIVVAFGMSRVAPTPSIWPSVVLATPVAPQAPTPIVAPEKSNAH
jgi:hypothetical protein